jgi:hypothetical protein
MPFSREFDDVYAAIKTSVESALSTSGGRCFRLDEARPAGRITDRLLRELQAAFMCIADLTGNTPNVMWEVGYAMALGKPIIIITQSIQELPFDLKDMQSLEYDRRHLSETLSTPLHRVVIDTVSAIPSLEVSRRPEQEANAELVAEMCAQVSELKSIVAQAVRYWNPDESHSKPVKDEAKYLINLEGAWVTKESGSHLYASVINGDLVVPYCYDGNDTLTGFFYGWRMVGEHWFSRFVWLDGSNSGFQFLKQESLDLLTGAWWPDHVGVEPSAPPPMKTGSKATLKRKVGSDYPVWATKFFTDVHQRGLNSFLKRLHVIADDEKRSAYYQNNTAAAQANAADHEAAGLSS